ncbi:MAG: penicillin-binding transpeptidase domain-containing protein, partial [Candidatus Beckwithbacteria bacterium]
DVPTCFNAPGQPTSYCPRNYDNTFHGPTQMRFALGNSYNIPAVKMLAANSVEAMVATASAMGITTYQDSSKYGLSLTLGGGEVKMVDMAVAFGVFANQGLKIDLTPILKIQDYRGKILEEIDLENELPVGQKAISPEVAFLISHILLDNNARAGGFGTYSQLVIPDRTVSVKTGTTDDLRDNWTIGYTPSFLVSTWVGNNDNSPMHPYLVSGVSGAAPIWHNIMEFILKDQPDEFPTQPENVIGLQICTLSGFRPNPEFPCETRFDYFIKGQEPTMEPLIKKGIWIDKSTNKPPVEGKTDDLELREQIILSDPVQKEYCLDCQKDVNEEGKVIESPYIVNIYPPEN